jgi:RND family efflux transporter MFP subunit
MALVGFAGCAVDRRFDMTRPGFVRVLAMLLLAAAAAPVSAAGPPLPVTVGKASEHFIAVARSAPATAVMLQRTEVAARLAAPVARHAVEVGDRVTRGALLVELECVDAENARDTAAARLEEAEARARLARRQLRRIGKLRVGDAASAEALDRAEAERDALTATVAALRSDLRRAQRDVERCSVRAPAAGTVTARHADAGDFVQPGTPLLTLVAASKLELRAHVTAGEADSLLSAREVDFRAHGRIHPLADARRTGVVEPTTGTEEVRFRFAAERPAPGVAGRIHWRTARSAIPPALVVRRDGQLGVFVIREDRARFHAVDGAVEGRPALTDLAADALLVIEGRHAVTDGAPVRIIE